MERFKIELFKEEHNIPFPDYTHLSDDECLKLIRRVSEKYNIPAFSLVEEISSKQASLGHVDAKDYFKLNDLLHELGIRPLSKVYINWYHFDEIDLFSFEDLNKYFDDIWFPSADDIDLFDESLDWIISIRHDGNISFLKSENT